MFRKAMKHDIDQKWRQRVAEQKAENERRLHLKYSSCVCACVCACLFLCVACCDVLSYRFADDAIADALVMFSMDLVRLVSSYIKGVSFASSIGCPGRGGQGQLDTPSFITVSPNGIVFVSADDGLQLFSADGKFQETFVVPFIKGLAIHPNGNLLMATRGGKIIQLDVGEQELVKSTRSQSGLFSDVYDDSAVGGLCCYGDQIYMMRRVWLAGGGYQGVIETISLSPNAATTIVKRASTSFLDRLVRVFCKGPKSGVKMGVHRSDRMIVAGSYFMGCACDSRGLLFVSDQIGHNVHIIDMHDPAKGRFVKTFGGRGKQEGQFDCPSGIAYDTVNNLILVADVDNHRVQAFSPDGVFQFAFGAHHLFYPSHVAVGPSKEGHVHGLPLIYVVDAKHGVSVFEMVK